jgi:hypothetical protein
VDNGVVKLDIFLDKTYLAHGKEATFAGKAFAVQH